MTIRRAAVFGLGIALLIILLGYLVTFTVNFDETVMVTTFGKATKESVKNAEGSNPGLYLKLPWPIQDVVRFDRRISVLEDRLEQQETSDKQVVIAKAYLTWRITDPLSFYRMFRTSERASEFLLERLRASKAELGAFAFDDLTNPDPEKVRIEEAGSAILARLRKDLSSHDTGIEIRTAGINRVLLPESITKSVFARMKQTRQRFAQNARSEGNAVAQSIVAKTESDKRRILAFAERMAQRLRAEGDAAAAHYYAEYSKSPEFAIFLRKLDALKQSLEKSTSYIVDTESEPFDLLEGAK